jgi:hypothetical protein
VRLGLDGKVAVVGGASTGLGYAVAEALAGERLKERRELKESMRPWSSRWSPFH